MQDITKATRQATREWLMFVRQKTGKSYTYIAREAGIATSTLTRHVNDPDYPHTLSTQTIAKIASKFGVSPPNAFDVTAEPNSGHGSGFSESEAVPYEPKGRGSDIRAAVDALIANRRGCDPWELRTRALELAGYLPGDIVIVDLNETPRTGDVVCAQVYDWERGGAETIWRIYEEPYLVAASGERLHRRPLLVDRRNVVVKGVVRGLFRERHPG